MNSINNSRRVRALVSGRVQGVFYRASTRQAAQNIGAVGWVKNLPDGRVEVLAEGSAQQLAALVEWCRVGPEYAQVLAVDVNEENPTGEFSSFEVLR